jgi:hypothetical protein
MFVVFFFVVQTGSGAYPASYPMGTGVKRPGLEADYSPQTSADVKNTWIYTSTPPYVFMVGWFGLFLLLPLGA